MKSLMMMTVLIPVLIFNPMNLLGSMIRQSLIANNKQSVRLQGFELLLYFIKGLRTPSNEQIDEQINWFSCAINLRPFVLAAQSESGFNVKLKNYPQEGR